MKRPRLLLLTTRFPYGKGEEFLETEIIYLAKHFDVTIIPWHPKPNLNIQRPIPTGVTLQPKITSPVIKNFIQLLKWFIHHPSNILILSKLLWKEISQFSFQPLTIRYFLNFAIHAIDLSNFLTKHYASKQIDIIYSYWLSPSALAGVLLKQKGITNVVISRAHRGDLYHDRAPLGYLPTQAQLLESIDNVFCISKHGVDYLRNHHPTHRAKIQLSRLGVHPAPTSNIQSEDGRLHLVSCAYLTPVKRIHLLIASLAQLTMPITWTHLGGGALEAAIKEQARALPLNVQWSITGHLSNHTIHHFYQKNPVDLFINVSESEGLPVSIMEALSYSIPVAATDVGGIKELIRPKKMVSYGPRVLLPKLLATH